MNCHTKVFVIHLVPVLAYLADMNLHWFRAWADFSLSVFWLAEGNVLYALLIVGDRIFFWECWADLARRNLSLCVYYREPVATWKGYCYLGKIKYILAQMDKVIRFQLEKKITCAEDNVSEFAVTDRSLGSIVEVIFPCISFNLNNSHEMSRYIRNYPPTGITAFIAVHWPT